MEEDLFAEHVASSWVFPDARVFYFCYTCIVFKAIKQRSFHSCIYLV